MCTSFNLISVVGNVNTTPTQIIFLHHIVRPCVITKAEWLWQWGISWNWEMIAEITASAQCAAG